MTTAANALSPTPLRALVLAGGRSTRMGRDKAAINYGGRSQLERAVALLQPLVESVHVSIRADQRADPLRSRFPQIVDRGDVAGPARASRRTDHDPRGVARRRLRPAAARCQDGRHSLRTASLAIGHRLSQPPRWLPNRSAPSTTGRRPGPCSLAAWRQDLPPQFLLNSDTLRWIRFARGTRTVNTPDELAAAVTRGACAPGNPRPVLCAVANRRGAHETLSTRARTPQSCTASCAPGTFTLTRTCSRLRSSEFRDGRIR